MASHPASSTLQCVNNGSEKTSSDAARVSAKLAGRVGAAVQALCEYEAMIERLAQEKAQVEQERDEALARIEAMTADKPATGLPETGPAPGDSPTAAR